MGQILTIFGINKDLILNLIFITTKSVVFYSLIRNASKIYLAHFFINGTPLPTCNSVRDLGVVINESLSPSSHIAQITATAYQRVNLIFSCFVSRDDQILLRAYTTYVRPLLEYCTVVWPHSLKCDIHSIEKVQKKFTK